MSTQTATVNKTEKRVNVRYLTVTAMLSAVAYILMFLEFFQCHSCQHLLKGSFRASGINWFICNGTFMWCRCMFDQKTYCTYSSQRQAASASYQTLF